MLLFHHKNWFRLLESDKGESFSGKDAVYRFLNHNGYAWRRFLSLLSSSTIDKIQPLTGEDRVSVFIVDDSMFKRNRSKAVELLSRFKDHATGCYYKGFRMLTLGWSGGHTFIPVDFSLLASLKSQVNGIMEGIDKRTLGYIRRMETLLPSPEVIPSMIDRAISAGVRASYVLMDSWFTHAPLIQSMLDRGLDVIGMVKADKKRYLVSGRRLTLQELYYEAIPVQRKSKGIVRSIRTMLAPGIPVTIVFVRHRSNKKEWLAILCTDLNCLKKRSSGSAESAGTSRYISPLDWAIALRQLIELIEDVAKKTSKKLSKQIQCQLQQWIAALPSSIKTYLPNLGCES